MPTLNPCQFPYAAAAAAHPAYRDRLAGKAVRGHIPYHALWQMAGAANR